LLVTAYCLPEFCRSGKKFIRLGNQNRPRGLFRGVLDFNNPRANKLIAAMVSQPRVAIG
jgi:hypothetical protein